MGPTGLNGELPATAASRPSTRRLVLIGIAVVLCLAAILRGLQSTIRLDDDSGAHHSWSYSTTGFLALYEALERLGYRVERLTKSYGALPDPAEDAVLISLDPDDLSRSFEENVALEDSHPERLARWVEAGGRVVVTLPGRVVYRWRGVEIVLRDGIVPDVFGLDVEGDLRRRSFAKLLDGLPPGGSAGTDGRLRGEGPLAGSERELEPLDRTFSRALAPYLEPDRDGENAAGDGSPVLEAPRLELPIFELPEATGAAAGAVEDGAFLPLVSLDDDPLVLERSLGKGSVICVASPFFFANAALHLDAVAQAAIELLHHASDGGRRRIIFDEYTHNFIRRGGALRWVRETALVFPLATVLFAICLLAWYGAFRFGPPAPVREVTRRAKEEFVLSLGELHRRAGHRLFALQLIARGYTAHIDALLGRSGRSRATRAGGGFEVDFEDGLDREPPDDAELLRRGRALHARYVHDLELVTGKPGATRTTGNLARQAPAAHSNEPRRET